MLKGWSEETMADFAEWKISKNCIDAIITNDLRILEGITFWRLVYFL